MRKLLQSSNVVYLGRTATSYDRRPPSPRDLGLTCIVLVRHGESASGKAILVSDTGIYANAVWVPKSMVVIEMPSERGILVASMSKAFAQQKNLCERAIDPTLFNEATREVLADANARAARKRNFYRRFRAPTANCMNRNVFA